MLRPHVRTWLSASARCGLGFALLCAVLLFAALPTRANYDLGASGRTLGDSRRILLIGEARSASEGLAASSEQPESQPLGRLTAGDAVMILLPVRLYAYAAQVLNLALSQPLAQRGESLLTSRGPPSV